MPRSSRHKSSHHRQHRRRERSNSDTDEERKQQKSDSEGPERRKVASLVESPEKKSGTEGRYTGKNLDLSVVGERWNEDGNEERKQEKRVLEKEKERRRCAEKEKERRRRDGDETREKERSGRENLHDRSRDKDTEKERKMEKEPERERRTKRGRDEVDVREREGEFDREVKDVVRKKFSDGVNKRSGSGGGDREKVKGSLEHGDQHEVHNSELVKDISRKTRRKDYSGTKEEVREVNRDCDASFPVMDDCTRNGAIKNEKYIEECNREKHREDFDRKGRTQHNKHQDNHNTRPEVKYSKEVDKISENHSKKNRIQENGRENSPYLDEYSVTHKEKNDKKRSSDDFFLHNDPKSQIKKENQGRENSTLEVNHGRNNSERHKFMDTAHNYPRTKNPKTASQVAKSKYSLEQVSSTKRELSPEYKIHKDSDCLGDLACEKNQRNNSASSGVSETHSLERTITQKELPLDDLIEQPAASSGNQVTPRSHVFRSPSKLSEKQSSYTGRKHVNRSGEEMEKRTHFSKDGRGHSTGEKGRDFSHGRQESINGSLERDMPNGDSLPVGSFSSNKVDHISSCSASPLRSSSARHGTGSPASGSDGDRFQTGERRYSGRSNRIGEPNFGRGHPNSFKGVFNWPSPVGNGFIPFQHGPPPGGFYPVMQQFPVPPMFGVRPPMDLNQSGIPFYINEGSNRLSGHNHPYGWGDHGDDPFPPNLQAWEGSNGMFGDGYGNRSGWEQKNHVTTNPGSEMIKDSLEEQNESLSMQCIDSQKEAAVSGQDKQSQINNIEVKGSQDIQSRMQTDDDGVSLKIPNKPSKLSDNDDSPSFNVYLSKLDISSDLAQPELLRQWNETITKKRNIAIVTTAAPENLEIFKVSMRRSVHACRLFPVLPDSIFQRAISVYKKESGIKTNLLISNPESKDVVSHPNQIDSVAKLSPDAKPGNTDQYNFTEDVNNLPALQARDAKDPVFFQENAKEAKGVECDIEASHQDASILENANPCSCTEDNSNHLGEHLAEVEDYVVSPGPCVTVEIVAVGKLSSPQNNFIGNADQSVTMEVVNSISSFEVVDSSDILANDEQSDAMCTAEGSSRGCDVLMPDCRVTLSRIHHSPESTH